MEETIQRPVHLGSNNPLNFRSVDSLVAKIILVDIGDELTDVHTEILPGFIDWWIFNDNYLKWLEMFEIEDMSAGDMIFSLSQLPTNLDNIGGVEKERNRRRYETVYEDPTIKHIGSTVKSEIIEMNTKF